MSLAKMALASKAKIPVPGSADHVVRGLNLVDVLTLVDRYREPITQAFKDLAGADDEALKSNAQIGGAVLKALPEVAADIIVLASDDPENGDPAENTVEAVKTIVASTQLLLLEKIAALTFAAEGGAGKVFEIVINAVGGTSSLVKALKA